MSVATAFPEDDYRCESCGCVFRILDSNAPPNLCPACGTRFQKPADVKAKSKAQGTGQRIATMDRAREKRESFFSDAIKRFIDGEDKRKPLTDDRIVGLLKEQEINVSRRLVTKLRKKLNIPSSRKRRERETD